MLVAVPRGTLPLVHAASGDHTSQIIPMTTGPDFSISASPSRLDFPTAHNTTLDASVVVTSIGGFSGTVNLTASVSSNYPPVPMLPSASPSTNMVTIAPSTSASLLLAIFVNSSIVAHQFDVEVGGMSSTISHSFGITVVVGPDFNMTMQTRNLIVHQGSIEVATLTFSSTYGYAGTIAAYSGLIPVNPPYPDIQLYPSSPSLLPNGGNSSLVVVKTDSGTGLGTYQVAIEATDDVYGGYLGESLPYTVTVVGPSSGPDFRMYTDPSQVSASLGNSVDSIINLIGVGGYNGPVTLYTSIGHGADVSPVVPNLSSTVNSTSTFSMTLPGPTPGGGGPGWWYSSGIGTVIVIAADPTGLAHEASINITATPFSFRASPNPDGFLRPNSTATIGLNLGSIGGFNGTVALAVASSPGIIATLDSNVLNFSALPSSLNSQLEVHVPVGASDGDHVVLVTATYMKPEYLPFSTAPKQALTYTLPVDVFVKSPTGPPTTIFGLQPVEFYGLVTGLSAVTVVSGAYFALRRRKVVPGKGPS